MRFYEKHVYLSVEWAVTRTGAHVEGVTLSTMWLHEKESHGEVKAAGTTMQVGLVMDARKTSRVQSLAFMWNTIIDDLEKML